jgi:deazaflavin-dependent oxidoreductase (nitroreductase family)
VGLAEDLNYAIPAPNPLQRSVQAIVSTRPGAWVLSKTLPAMDRTVARLTAGRSSVSELGAGLPIVVLTTTGRKSGLPRNSQLIAIPFGEALAVIGTNYGTASTPAWVLNLEADPRATLAHEATAVDVAARAATEAERVQILARSATIYGGYAKYLSRISGRQVRIFVLERASA